MLKHLKLLHDFSKLFLLDPQTSKGLLVLSISLFSFCSLGCDIFCDLVIFIKCTNPQADTLGSHGGLLHSGWFELRVLNKHLSDFVDDWIGNVILIEMNELL